MSKVIFLLMLCVTTVFALTHNQRIIELRPDSNECHTILQLEDQMALRMGNKPSEAIKVYTDNLSNLNKHLRASGKMASGLNNSWTAEGPVNIGGRFNMITFDPMDTNTLYAGACMGGVFKTRNYGKTWYPIFDNQPFLSIGTITIDPHNHKKIYVGTGDVNINAYVYTGNGIYCSNDSGVTWVHLGLSEQKIISKIIVDPKDSNTLYAATMGNPFTRDSMRGLYKTVDGGKTWKQILYLAKDAGVIELHMHPTDTKTLYAVGYNRIRFTNLTEFAGYKSRVYKSTDAGNTWDTLKNGLPTMGLGRPSLAVSRSNPAILYLLNVDSTGNIQGLYKSSNAGYSFTACKDSFINALPLNGQGWYSGGIRINPWDPKELFLCGVDLYKTTDSAFSWGLGAPIWQLNQVHADMHDVVYISPKHLLLCTDGGLYSTLNGGTNWNKIDKAPVSQFYHITVNPYKKGYYAGGLQDNGTVTGGKSGINKWMSLYGGDGFKIKYVPGDSTLVLYETQNGDITLYDNSIKSYHYLVQSTAFPKQPRNWDMDYILDASDNTTIYYGTNKIHRTDIYASGDDSISNILTDSIYLATDARFHTITTLAQSTINNNYLFAGTSDGHLWKSSNLGTSWKEITHSLPKKYVTHIIPSPNALNVIYVSYTGYKDNDTTVYIYKSTDTGTSWKNIKGNLPPMAVNRILPYTGNDSLIIAATDAGVYVTYNTGLTWTHIGNNMPSIPVYDLAWDTANHKLMAGTFGRSLMSYNSDSILKRLSSKVTNTFLSANIKMYPNPASDKVYIQLPQLTESVKLDIYNIAGEKVFTNIYNRNTVNINTSTLPQGMYIININYKNVSCTKKLLIVR